MLRLNKLFSKNVHNCLIQGNCFLKIQQINGRNYTSYNKASCRSYLTLQNFTNKRREYVKKELLGYSMEQMYEVVSDVSNYYRFVPYVKKSFVHSRRKDSFKADLIVGFPPLNEQYTSTVSLSAPHFVQSVCNDGRLFNYLLNEWRFSAGLKDIPQSCVLDFKVAFEFRTLIHSNIANLFFDMVCAQMEDAFVEEAKRRFGMEAVKSHILSSRKS